MHTFEFKKNPETPNYWENCTKFIEYLIYAPICLSNPTSYFTIPAAYDYKEVVRDLESKGWSVLRTIKTNHVRKS